MTDISVRTLVNLAEDNGLTLYPYVFLPKGNDVISFPFIAHRRNHFDFIDDEESFSKYRSSGCIVLLNEQDDRFQVPKCDLQLILGASWIAAGVAAAGATYQIVKGVKQKKLARKLAESKFVPKELSDNRDLAQQQAMSRRAPGQALAEENIRRSQANQISAGQRSFGGDVNKTAAITSAATAQANDANRAVAAQGQAFSEGAFNRLSNANSAIAGQRRQNRSEYNSAKAALIGASDQNIYNGINNASTAALAGMSGSGGGGGFSQGGGGGGGGSDALMRELSTGIYNDGSKRRRNSASSQLQSRMPNPPYWYGQQNQDY